MTKIGTDIPTAVEVLRAGGLVGLPTETVYGLAADAASPAAVAQVFAAKGRPADHPLIVHVAEPADLDRYGRDVPEAAHRLARRWWPGPLTLLVRRSTAVPDAVTGGRDTVALRSPAHPLARELLVAFGAGLVAPSANRFGKVSPTTAADVVAELGDAVDLVLDGGPCRVGIESTIVDLVAPTPRILRMGHVTVADLREDVPEVEVAGATAPAIAPGMLAAHYAPDARVAVLAAGATATDVSSAAATALRDGRRVGVLAPDVLEGLDPGIVALDPAGDPDSYARVLYARLREADARGLDLLVVVPPPDTAVGAAVNDRLRRAAHRS